METIQTEIISRLEKAHTTEDWINLMLASQLINSKSHYEDALQGLIHSEPYPTLEQARRIGFDATYAIFSAITQQNSRGSRNSNSYNGKWHGSTIRANPLPGNRFQCPQCSSTLFL
jgi:hypothetical protein